MVLISCDYCAKQKPADSPRAMDERAWLMLEERIDPWDSRAGDIYPGKLSFCSPRCVVLWIAARWPDQFGETLTMPDGGKILVAVPPVGTA